MENSKLKVVQTEVSDSTYELFKDISKSKSLTIKKATSEAIREWMTRNGDLSKDPLFDISKVLNNDKKTDSSKVDEVVYSQEGIE